MYFKIDPSNGVPIYLQIVQQMKTHIAMGRLLPEDPLPSVRKLAVDLSINPNTVARAYLDLEHEGVIYKRQGQGTFVSHQGVEMSKRERRRIFSELVEKAIVEGIQLGMKEAELREIVNQRLGKILLARGAEKL
ncbi:MAG: GntR family transcriptional regulator [Acidobacteriia bacterium]|nr:GntR family transcriptional regulator [Terriglobia bacterium]